MREISKISEGVGLSRRSLLIATTTGALTSLVNSKVSANAIMSVTYETNSANLDAISTAFAYLKSRANFKNFLERNEFKRYLHPDAKGVINFEAHRLEKLSLLGSKYEWNGLVDKISNQPELISSFQNESKVQLVVKDWTSISWRPAPPLDPIERTADEWTLVRNDPIRYGLDVPSWSLVTSGFGTLHAITLEKIGSSWKIIADNYTEGTLGLKTESQSFIESSAFKNGLTKYPSSKQESANLNFTVSNQPKSRKLTTRTFDYAAAVSYALYWAD